HPHDRRADHELRAPSLLGEDAAERDGEHQGGRRSAAPRGGRHPDPPPRAALRARRREPRARRRGGRPGPGHRRADGGLTSSEASAAMPSPFEALVHRGYQNGYVGGLVQDVIRAGGQGGGHYVQVYGSGHHHYRHVFAVVQRANQPDQLHAVDAIESITDERRVVVGVATELLARALAVAVPGRVPVVAGEDVGEHLRHTCVAVRDKYRLHAWQCGQSMPRFRAAVKRDALQASTVEPGRHHPPAIVEPMLGAQFLTWSSQAETTFTDGL